MAARVREYKELLKDVSRRSDEADQILIGKALDKVGNSVNSPR